MPSRRARVTKRTLYYHFRSKDNLIAAYLDRRDQPNLAMMARWFGDARGSPADRVEAIFHRLAEAARHPRWRGCAFLRTSAELAAMPGHPALKIGARHKRAFED
jgi:AcrR family transcriptional regulator